MDVLLHSKNSIIGRLCRTSCGLIPIINPPIPSNIQTIAISISSTDPVRPYPNFENTGVRTYNGWIWHEQSHGFNLKHQREAIDGSNRNSWIDEAIWGYRCSR